jgi:hypothetical protein
MKPAHSDTVWCSQKPETPEGGNLFKRLLDIDTLYE